MGFGAMLNGLKYSKIKGIQKRKGVYLSITHAVASSGFPILQHAQVSLSLYLQNWDGMPRI
jgi:hypothetical protein